MTYVRECGNKYVVGLWADFKKTARGRNGCVNYALSQSSPRASGPVGALNQNSWPSESEYKPILTFNAEIAVTMMHFSKT